MKVVMEFFVRESDVASVLKLVRKHVSAREYAKLSIGNCGWANAPDCWWVRFKCDTHARKEIVDGIVGNRIELYNPALIY